ncbi:MAG: sulfurtransferase TusA family protein [Euryarchaeota archaeon]|nr:sulfurtransferase TusA family protein [Euryarchaeota archaeon]
MKADEVLDTSGMVCPMPVLKTRKAAESLEPGKVLKVIATDRGAKSDIPAWAKNSGFELLGVEEEGGKYVFYIRKPGGKE